MSGSQVDPADAAICEPIRQPMQFFPVLRIGFTPCFIACWRISHRKEKTFSLFSKPFVSLRLILCLCLLTGWCKRAKENLCTFGTGLFRPRFLFCNTFASSQSVNRSSCEEFPSRRKPMFPFLSGQPVGLGSDRPQGSQNLRTAFAPLPPVEFQRAGTQM